MKIGRWEVDTQLLKSQNLEKNGVKFDQFEYTIWYKCLSCCSSVDLIYLF